ncbi:EAL domain-containing protein [Bosea sp. 117]|uniref:putative bifunctional diguanylate cyclase/phosphodiesterase n=1 Tax=Bosea sp. 117 TaxID=1125973 RepID=UPI00068BCD3E|nr:EAL domain-containing protein [Bosea sp. 117]
MAKQAGTQEASVLDRGAHGDVELGIARQGLDAALESMSDGFALFDAGDRMILHNRRFLEFFPFLASLGDLRGRDFRTLVSIPTGEWMHLPSPETYVEERMRRHFAADGQPFDIPLTGGGWARVRERRTPEGGIVSTWTDVTELKLAEQRLREAIAAIGEGFVLLDTQHRISLCNARFREMFAAVGILPMAGMDFADLLHRGADAGLFLDAHDDAAAFVSRTIAALDGEGERRLEIALKDGGWVLACHRGTSDGGGVGIWTDLTAQRRREMELVAIRTQLERQSDALSEFARLLARQARGDALTGLPNRFALEERLEQQLREGAAGIWVAFIDIDDFKTVNDTAGYAAGDELLREFAQFLAAQLPEDDMLARVSGDEFVIVLSGVDETEAMSRLIELAQAVRQRSFEVSGRSIHLDLSIGLVAVDTTRTTVSTLLAAADTACYRAKDAGGGRIQLYEPGGAARTRTPGALTWEERVALALEADLFILHLQAIVDDSGVVHGYEALLRLVDEQGVVHAPGHFLPTARRLGVMDRIDMWVCRRAVRYATRLANAHDGRYLSMNVGVRTLADTRFQELLIAEINDHPGVEAALRVEITETDQIENIEELGTFLGQLRALGIKLYLDDFGSGYNSFDVLKRLHVDGLKIEWAVTRDLLNDPIDEALIKAAASIADSLGLELVAEGVEQEEQLTRLRALGVSLFQGHYFHVAEDAEALLPPE